MNPRLGRPALSGDQREIHNGNQPWLYYGCVLTVKFS
jgi:hypothetical protein